MKCYSVNAGRLRSVSSQMAGSVVFRRGRLKRPLLLHHGQCHAHELAGDTRECDIVVLFVHAPFPVVVIPEVGV